MHFLMHDDEMCDDQDNQSGHKLLLVSDLGSLHDHFGALKLLVLSVSGLSKMWLVLICFGRCSVMLDQTSSLLVISAEQDNRCLLNSLSGVREHRLGVLIYM